MKKLQTGATSTTYLFKNISSTAFDYLENAVKETGIKFPRWSFIKLTAKSFFLLNKFEKDGTTILGVV